VVVGLRTTIVEQGGSGVPSVPDSEPPDSEPKAGKVSFDFMAEQHLHGLVTIENRKMYFQDAEVGIMFGEDGRFWVCVNGECLLRFKPE